MLLNNCCESFNNVLKDARTKPILSLMEWIRRYVMMRCCAKRQGLQNFEGTIMPSVVKMIERGQKEIYNMRLIQADLHVFEVQHDGDCFVVNLENKLCGCYRWTLMGIPCWHALACLAQRRLDYEDYVHQAYHVATYARTYAPKFNAMPGQNQWEVTPYPQPLPPSYKIMTGRPSKRKRRKEPGEGKKGKGSSWVKRPKRQNMCKRCGGLGHYQKSCIRPPMADGVVQNRGGRPRTRPLPAQPAQQHPSQQQPSHPAAPSPQPTNAVPRPQPRPMKQKHVAGKKKATTATTSQAKGKSAYVPKKKKTASVNAIQGSQPSQKSCISQNNT